MTSLSLHLHRPTPWIAAAAAVAAIATGSLAVSVADQSDHPSAPGHQAQVTGVHTPRTHHFHPMTSGGRVMLGE